MPDAQKHNVGDGAFRMMEKVGHKWQNRTRMICCNFVGIFLRAFIFVCVVIFSGEGMSYTF